MQELQHEGQRTLTPSLSSTPSTAVIHEGQHVPYDEAAMEVRPASNPPLCIHTDQQPQILLILVGLPGSGKTTFAESLVRLSEQEQEQYDKHEQEKWDGSEALNGPSRTGTRTRALGRRWIRASQDDAPSRRRQECEGVVRMGLERGWNVVVDRVDFDEV